MHRSRSQMAVFIGIISAILVVVDLVSYWAIHASFGYSWWVLWTLLVLSICFVATTIGGRYSYDPISCAIYAISASWLGVSAYALYASVLYGIVVLLGIVFGFAASTAGLVGQAFIAIAFLIGLYGIINGRRLKTKHVTVALPNLPEVWAGKKALWASDLHLGQIYGTKRAEKLVAIARATASDIIFIGGDLYDGSSVPAIIDLAEPLRDLGALAPKGVYFVMGNHEEFGDRAPFEKKIASLGMRILRDEMVTVDGLQLIGVDYGDAEKAKDFEAILARIIGSPRFDRSKPSILLKHEPRDLDIAEKAGISFQISGHVHRGQQWPFELIAKRIYKGFTYGLKRHGALQVYVSSGAGTWGPPLRVGSDSEAVVFTFTKG